MDVGHHAMSSNRIMCSSRIFRAATAAMLLAVMALGMNGCGGHVADTLPDAAPDAPCAGVTGSFYLGTVRPGVIAVDEMKPTLLSPRVECLPAACPQDLQNLPGGRPVPELIRDYFCALGPLALGHQTAAGSLANDVSRRLAAHWRALRAASLATRVASPPLRILVKHYPRPDAPGHCVTLCATFYNVPDPHFDRAGGPEGPLGEDGEREERLPGALVRLSGTWQLVGGEARLVEAWIEAAAGLDRTGAPPPFRDMLGVRGLAVDGERDAHFDDLGAGRRWGLGWFDRAYGLQGEARPSTGSDPAAEGPRDRFWRGMWRMQHGETVTGPLPDAWLRALRAVILRV